MSLAQQTLLGGPTGVHGADDRHRRPHSVDDGIYVRPAATQRTGDPGIDLELLPNEKLQALLTNEEVLQEYLTSWLASSAVSQHCCNLSLASGLCSITAPVLSMCA